MKRVPLLIVEDDPTLQKQLAWALDDFEVHVADRREPALVLLRRVTPPVVSMDLGLPPDASGVSEGFALLEAILAVAPTTKVVVLTGQHDEPNALRAVALGAYDFLEKPVDADALRIIIARAVRLHEWQARTIANQAAIPARLPGITTCDPAMLAVCRTVMRLAAADVSVMLLGESGTGKEGLSRALHTGSRRAAGRFVAINCAAIPDNLLEAELFGYERGAFTGAARQTIGKIELAQRGTLFLDEIGDLPHALQAKLLRFLQERVIERVGGRHEIPVDVRVVSATHQNLNDKIAAGQFRQDLYFRLAEVVVDIPPLRDRVGDAVALAHYFLERFRAECNRGLITFSPDALDAIEQHRWPGNVRELENCIRRAVIMSDTDRLNGADLGLITTAIDADQLTLRTVRDNAERDAVLRVLARENGNVLQSAAQLGISRPTLYDLMNRFGLREPTEKRTST